MPDRPERPRRTQQERSATTRARVLDAAYGCLLDGGYAATTVGAVQLRAGVARGTLLHHFPTRGSLMAGVIEDIVERRMTLLQPHDRRAETPREPQSADRAGGPSASPSWSYLVDAVWAELQGPAFAVALELWVAARTDAELREALLPLQEQIFGTVHERISALVGTEGPQAALLAQFTVDLLAGTFLTGILAPRQGTELTVEGWKRALRTLADAQED